MATRELMDTIVILDYATASVIISKCPITMTTESFISDKGMREKDVAWIRGEHVEIYKEYED